MPRIKTSNIRKYFVYDASTNKSICQYEIPKTDIIELLESEAELGSDANNGSETGRKSQTPAAKKRKKSLLPIRNHEGQVKYVFKNDHPSLIIDGQEKCGHVITGDKASNLKTHMKSFHPEEYEKFLEEENNLTKSPVQVGQSHKQKDGTNALVSTQTSLSSIFPAAETFSCKVTVLKEQVRDGILEMMTVNGRPFSILNDSGFIRAFGPILTACGLILNCHNIKDHIHAKRLQIEKYIQSFKHQLVSLKVDYAIRLDQSFMGINLQLIENGEIKVYNLATTKISDEHNEENLKKIILSVIAKFELKQENIYSITTDNGSSLIKAVDLMSESDQYNEQNHNDEPSIWDEDSIYVHGNEDTIELVLNTDWSSSVDSSSTRYAVHTMQLCVPDSLKDIAVVDQMETYNDILNKARNVVKTLRTENIMKLIREEKLPIPVLDCLSRWSSSHRMLTSLIKLRPFCDKMSVYSEDLLLSEADWNIISEMHMCLEPAKKALTKLQRESLTLTDCHKIWDMCHYETAVIGTAFAQILVDNYVKRRAAIFENDIFYAAMFLDPRFQFDLCDTERETAINHIMNIHKKLTLLRLVDREDNIDNITFDDSAFNNELNNLAEDEKDERLYEHRMRVKHRDKLYRTTAGEFETLCRTFSPVRIKSSENVLKWWLDHQATYPDLFEVAMVVYAVPCTQFSAEQLLSQIRFILDPLRNDMSDDILDDVLLLKSNLRHFI